jgi:hypothetical protein
MKIHKSLVVLLVALSLSSSAFEATQVYAQDDMGMTIFQQFTYSIAIDCENAQLRVIVMDANNTPVEGATVYLQYLENSNPLVSTQATPENGTTIHQLPGNTSYMRSQWNLLIEKEGYRSKVVQFDLAPCYSDWTPTITPFPDESETTGTETGSHSEYNESNGQESDIDLNDTNENNTASDVEAQDEEQENFLSSLVPLVLVISLVLIIIKYLKHRESTKPNFSSSKLYWRKKKRTTPGVAR